MEQWIEASDGHVLFTRLLKPQGESIGHIHLLHGMAEHSGRYLPFAENLVAEGYTVSMHDHRGHGRTAEQNGAPFGFFAEQDGFLQAVKDVETVARAVVGDEKFLLFGHSMGSFIARRYAQLYPERLMKLIICGTGTATLQHAAGKSLAHILAEKYGSETPSVLMDDLSFKNFNQQFKPNRTNFDWLAQNAEAVDDYIADPYCGFIATTRFYEDLLGGILAVSKQGEVAKIPNIPIMLISGSKDPVGQNGAGVFTVAKQLTKAGKEHVHVYLVDDMRHEILNEKNRAHTIAHIKRWLRNDE